MTSPTQFRFLLFFLFIEVLLEGGKLVLLQDTTLPPRLDEAEAVAHQLREGSGDAEKAHPKTLVLETRVKQDDSAIK